MFVTCLIPNIREGQLITLAYLIFLGQQHLHGKWVATYKFFSMFVLCMLWTIIAKIRCYQDSLILSSDLCQQDMKCCGCGIWVLKLDSLPCSSLVRTEILGLLTNCLERARSKKACSYALLILCYEFDTYN